MSRNAWRTWTSVNGSMSTAMQSGSQPPPFPSRIWIAVRLGRVDLRERDVGDGVDLAGQERVHLRGGSAKSITVTWSKHGRRTGRQ